jgi:hypothetical protein
VGDYDNDGILDWFVSSVWDPDGPAGENWYASGNRLYRGRGDGTFDDVTDAAGVREGFWGWGSTFADFDNDGHLDIFHVNGWYSSSAAAQFLMDPSRLFVANGDGTFTERSAEVGLNDTGMGRGVVAFDYDRDGDLDLFVANGQGPSRLWRNDSPPGNHWLGLRLRGRAPNTEAIGARIWVRTGGTTQLRELRAGSNFESQDPAEAHFGLGYGGAGRRAADSMARRNDRHLDERRRRPAADVRATGRRMRHAERMCGGRPKPDVGVHRRDARRGVAVQKGRAQPGTCIDGDPACDADGKAGDGCLVSIGLCTGYPRFALSRDALPCGRDARLGNVRNAGGGRTRAGADGGVRDGLGRPLHRRPGRQRAAAATAERQGRHRQGRGRGVGDRGRRGEGRGPRRPALRAGAPVIATGADLRRPARGSTRSPRSAGRSRAA